MTMFNFHYISIKNKIRIVIILTSGLILLLTSIAFVVNDLISYRRLMITNLFTLANLIGINSTAGLLFNNSHTVKHNIAALKAHPDVILTHIFSNKGKNFASYFKKGVDIPLQPSSLTLHDYYYLPLGKAKTNQAIKDNYFFHRNHLAIFSEITYKGRKIGTVYIQSDLKPFKVRLILAGIIVIVVWLIALWLTFLLSSKLQTVITQPIYNLLNMMKTVSEQKNYTIRGKKQGDDELGRLMSGFNEMLKQIEIRDKNLSHANKNLSDAVVHLKKTQDELIQSEKNAQK